MGQIFEILMTQMKLDHWNSFVLTDVLVSGADTIQLPIVATPPLWVSH